MEDEATYDKMAELVDSIEASRAGEETTIDLSEVFANRLTIKKVAYVEADRMLEKVRIKEVPQPAPQAQQPKPQVQVPKREIGKEKEAAAASLRGMVAKEEKGGFIAGIERKMEEAEEAKLVMPKLSLQDQLSDLEKIREGLDENVFDKTQLKIIKEEMKGMTQISSREDVSKMSEDQRELVLMRNQRIKEIKGRLNT